MIEHCPCATRVCVYSCLHELLIFSYDARCNLFYISIRCVCCRAAETMRGAWGKNFEWGLMTSPRKTFINVTTDFKVHPVFQAPFPVQFIYLLHFFVLGALHWLGPGANSPPASPPLGGPGLLMCIKKKFPGVEPGGG